jgi:hypothetical protein
MESKKQLFINGDWNDYSDGYFSLRNPIWIKKLINEYGPLRNGQKVWLFYMALKNNKAHLQIFPGEIRDVEPNGECKVYVDEKDVMDLAQSQEFKEYNISDVIGTEWFDLIKEKHPEWL